jgi:hypothetical protein
MATREINKNIKLIINKKHFYSAQCDKQKISVMKGEKR